VHAVAIVGPGGSSHMFHIKRPPAHPPEPPPLLKYPAQRGKPNLIVLMMAFVYCIDWIGWLIRARVQRLLPINQPLRD